MDTGRMEGTADSFCTEVSKADKQQKHTYLVISAFLSTPVVTFAHLEKVSLQCTVLGVGSCLRRTEPESPKPTTRSTRLKMAPGHRVGAGCLNATAVTRGARQLFKSGRHAQVASMIGPDATDPLCCSTALL